MANAKDYKELPKLSVEGESLHEYETKRLVREAKKGTKSNGEAPRSGSNSGTETSNKAKWSKPHVITAFCTITTQYTGFHL